jgi:hypothetical protein
MPTHGVRSAITMWMSCGEPGPAPALLPSATERLRLEEEVATITARMQGDAARLQQAQAQLGSSVVPPPALALAPALALPSHDTTKNGLIFVSVACFRDPECQWTLHNLFQTAADPHRIRVGVVWQVRQILPLPISSYRFKFQSNLVWDSIKSISNFCFQF